MELERLFILPSDSPIGTFTQDTALPPLPVPPLDHTLNQYLDSLRPFATAEELVKTEETIKTFQHGVGKKLHEMLCKKARKEKNWLEKWWEDYAYLTNRQPLIPYCSFSGISYLEEVGLIPNKKKALQYWALNIYHFVSFWKLLRTNRLRPTQSPDGSIIFSSNLYRRLFNTVRIPGLEIDELKSYFKTEKEGECSSNVILLCNGRIFCVDSFCNGTQITPSQWKTQLQHILDICDDNQGQSVSVLSCDERTSWAKNRKSLQELSRHNCSSLQIIESAMLVVCLDPNCPDDTYPTNFCTLNGDYSTRWPDKSISTICYANGVIGGLGEHAAFDGMISSSVRFYIYLCFREKGLDFDGDHPPPQSPPKPDEIIFSLDENIKQEIIRAHHDTQKNQEDALFLTNKFTDYGKNFIKTLKLHPNSFVQMALQLTYYKLHNKPAPTYETAVTRQYYNGRTETVRSCTIEAINWVQAMLNTNIHNSEKERLLRVAIKKHDLLTSKARNNAGCDRHLFGLYILSMENNLPLPELFQDPLFVKSGGGGNYILSTSLAGYTPLGGGAPPMVTDGYGAFYIILPNEIGINVTVWRDSFETSKDKFFASLCSSLQEMKEIFDPLTNSKL